MAVRIAKRLAFACSAVTELVSAACDRIANVVFTVLARVARVTRACIVANLVYARTVHAAQFHLAIINPLRATGARAVGFRAVTLVTLRGDGAGSLRARVGRTFVVMRHTIKSISIEAVVASAAETAD